jgi:heptose-I-phosphate ethanolaminephosphotransferase
LQNTTKRPENIKRIEKALNRPFMTDNIVHMFLDLAGIETKQYDASKSVINDAYVPRERLINGIRYEDLKD